MNEQQLIQYLKNPTFFWISLSVFNVACLLLNIVINFANTTIYNHKRLPFTKSDIAISLLNVIVNILIAIPAYYLFKNGYIHFTNTYFIRDFLILFFTIDMLMYFFHRISHYVYPFTLIHEKHHTHTSFNEISLYVMNPIESIALGIILTLVVLLFTCNLYSFCVFLFINWLYGVISHLNTKADKEILFFGNQVFHQNHHTLHNVNFGFYTKTWDYLFKTLHVNENQKT